MYGVSPGIVTVGSKSENESVGEREMYGVSHKPWHSNRGP